MGRRTSPERTSIRRKTMLLVVVSLCAAVTASLTLLFVGDAQRDAEARAREVIRRAHVFAYAVGVAAGDGRIDDINRILRAVRDTSSRDQAAGKEAPSGERRPSVTFVMATGETFAFIGEPTLGTDVVVTDDMAAVDLLQLYRSRMIQAAVPVVNDGIRIGTLTLTEDASDFLLRLRNRLLLTFAGLLPGLGIGLLIAGKMTGRIVRPITEMTRAAEEIRDSHDYSRRVAVDTTDEVGALADGFNAMLDEIGKRDRTLAAHRRSLESDVAERTREYLVAKDAAEAANAAKSEFLATMSHEIRTPLNGIMAMAELLASSGIAGRQRRYADVIVQSGRSLLSIINDVLDLSKIEAGRMDLEAIEASPAAIVDQVVGLFAERARSKGLDLAAFVDPSTPRFLRTDPTRLSQVVANLVNNALKFTDDGGVLVTAGPSPDAPDRLRIEVTDTGPGIPPEKIDTIFEAFRQADASTTRRHGGTGLGLSIARRIVSAMAGTLSVSSTVRKGTAFVVEIPMVDPVADMPWPSVRAGSTVRLEGLRPMTTAAMSAYLTSAGFTVGDAAEPDLLVLGADARPDLSAGDRCAVIRVTCPGEEPPADPKASLLECPFRSADIRDLFAALVAGDRAAGRVAEAPHRTVSSDVPPDFSHVRVLVVDDNAVNREVALEALARFHVVADVAATGAEAVERLSGTRYRIVFMDGSMPEMDGFEATRRIRAREAQQHLEPVTIVAFTAQVIGSDNRRWREVGVDAELPKPFTLAALQAILERFAQARPLAPAVVAQPDPDLLDRRTVVQMEQLRDAGRPDFGRRIAHLYRDNAAGVLSELDAAEASRDVDHIRRAAHALKSMSHSAGAGRAAEAAARLETAAAAGQHLVSAEIAALKHLVSASVGALLARFDPSEPAVRLDDPTEADLAEALARGEIVPFFQPIVEARTGRPVACEALVRWKQPGGELISPAVFIPLAERTGLIRQIGRVVLTAGARAFARRPDLVLSVNASPRELEHEDYMDHVERILAEAALPPSRLQLEVTESALFDAETVVIPNLQRARALGITIALDDFGTGYSSLSLLKNFPFDGIKVDRSFAADAHVSIEARAIVEAVVSVGRTLGKSVTAEGIETLEQQRFLAALGIAKLQGYLFGRPQELLPPEAPGTALFAG